MFKDTYSGIKRKRFKKSSLALLCICIFIVSAVAFVFSPESQDAFIPEKTKDESNLAIDGSTDATIPSEETVTTTSNEVDYIQWSIQHGIPYSMSELAVRITYPTVGVVFTTEWIEVSWTILGTAEYFEVFLNGTSLGTTTEYFFEVLTPDTDFELMVVAYGLSGEVAWDYIIFEKTGAGTWVFPDPTPPPPNNPTPLSSVNASLIDPTTHPELFYVYNGSQYMPYIFTDNGDDTYNITLKNVVYEVHNDPIGVRVFSRNNTMQVSYSWWVLQQWETTGTDHWKDIVLSNTELSYELHDNSVVITRNNTVWIAGQQSFFLEIYEFGCDEQGSLHKVSLEWNCTVTDSDNIYRFVWQFSGMPDNKNIGDAIYNNETRIEWWDSIVTNETYPVIIDWIDAEEQFDYIDVQGASGKMDVYFDNNTLDIGDKIDIDPVLSISDETSYYEITTNTYTMTVGMNDMADPNQVTINGHDTRVAGSWLTNARLYVRNTTTGSSSYKSTDTFDSPTLTVNGNNTWRLVLEAYEDIVYADQSLTLRYNVTYVFYDDFVLYNLTYTALSGSWLWIRHGYGFSGWRYGTIGTDGYGDCSAHYNGSHWIRMEPSGANKGLPSNWQVLMLWDNNSYSEILAPIRIADWTTTESWQFRPDSSGTQAKWMLPLDSQQKSISQGNKESIVLGFVILDEGGNSDTTATVGANIIPYHGMINNNGSIGSITSGSVGSDYYDESLYLYTITAAGNDASFTLTPDTGESYDYLTFLVDNYTTATFQMDVNGTTKTNTTDYFATYDVSAQEWLVVYNETMSSATTFSFSEGGSATPRILHSPYTDLNTTSVIETHLGLQVNCTVITGAGVSKVFLESNHTGTFVNYTMTADGIAYTRNIDISALNGSDRFCYRFFANDTLDVWSYTNRTLDFFSNFTNSDHDKFWVKIQYQIKKVIYWTWANDTALTIPIMQDLDVTGVVFSWYATKWHRPGRAKPGDDSVRNLFQKYVDAGYELYINLTVTKGTKTEDVPNTGYRDGTQDRMGTQSGKPAGAGDYNITIDRTGSTTPIDYTTPEWYWVVRDYNDSQFLVYGMGAEEWSYTNHSSTAVNVTIHSAEANHYYTVYYLYHFWNRIDMSTDVGSDLIIARMTDLLANLTDLITGVYLENMGFGGSPPYNVRPGLLDDFKTNQTITGANHTLLYYLYQRAGTDSPTNTSLWQVEWQEYCAKRIYEFMGREFVPLFSNFTVLVGWYRGDTNEVMSPEYMAKAGIYWEENWQGTNDWVGMREHLYGYEMKTDWAYDDDGNNIAYSFCHYVGGGSLETYRAWIIHQKSTVAIGAYPERINIGQSTNNFGLGGNTPDYTYQGIKEWINDFTQIRWILDNYDDYAIADVGIAEKLVMRYVYYGKIWYQWQDRSLPINFHYVNLEDVNNTGVPTGIDVLWLDGLYGGAVDNSTMEQIQTFVENGGGLLVTHWNATHYHLNLTAWVDTAIKSLIGVNQTGSTTDDTNFDMLRTTYGDTHWISADLPSTLRWDANTYGDMANFTSSVLSNYHVLYTMQKDSDDVGLSVADLGSGRVAFVIKGGGFTNMLAAGDFSAGDTAGQLFGRISAWLSQHENEWTYPTVDNDEIAVYLYNASDSFMIAVFNNNQTDSEIFTLNFNSTPIGFTEVQYVMFDAYNWEMVNASPYISQISGELNFTKTIANRTLMMIVCKPYGTPIHLHSNRTFISENWNGGLNQYTFDVAGAGLSAISINTTIGLPTTVTDNGVPLVEYGTLAGLGAVADGYYCNTTTQLLFIKSNGSTILVQFGTDAVAPSISSPPADDSYVEGDTGNTINWTWTDSFPNNYNITRNGVLIDSGNWASGVPIILDIDGLTEGTYTFICGVNDTTGNSASDTVTITVTAAPSDGDGAPSDGDGAGEQHAPSFELITINGLTVDADELVSLTTTQFSLTAYITAYAGGTTFMEKMTVKLTFISTTYTLEENSDHYTVAIDTSLMTLQLYTTYKLTLEAKKTGYDTIVFVCYLTFLSPPPADYDYSYLLIGIVCFTLGVIALIVYVHRKRYYG